MINHYDNETRLTAILRCVVDDTADAAMLLQLGPARTREEIFISRALGKKPWAAIPPRTTLEMWLAFIAEDEAEPAAGSYTVRSCAESCIITYARRVKGASAIVPIFPPHDPYEIALAKLAGIIPVGYGVQGRPWELLMNQLAERGPRKNIAMPALSIVRVNQWDEQWERGRLSTATGEPTAENGIRSADFIPIEPDTDYRIYCGSISSNDLRVLFYREDRSYIQATAWIRSGSTFAARYGTADARYIKFFVSGGTYGNEYRGDISINYPASFEGYYPYDSCAKYLGVGAWKLCGPAILHGSVTIAADTGAYDLAPSRPDWDFRIQVDGQTVTGATGALSVAAGEHSVIITATQAVGAATCYIHPTLYSEEATP